MTFIRYTGLQPEPETRFTGEGSVWFPGEMRDIESATRARQLLIADSGWEAVRDADVSGPFAPSAVAGLQALVSPDGNVSALLSNLKRSRPLYLLGDSLFARSTREQAISNFDLVVNGDNISGYMTPSPTLISPSGSPIRVYGFADSRLNFTSQVLYVSGVSRIPLPTGVNYAGMTTGAGVIASYPAATNAARQFNEVNVFYEQSLLLFVNGSAGKRYNASVLAEGGSTSARLAVLSATCFVGTTPGVLLLESSVNTFKNSETLANVEANYRTIIANAMAAGHAVILTTPTTFSSALAGYAPHNLGLAAQAQLMRELASELGLGLIDFYGLFVNPLSTDGQPVSGYTATDGIHWTQAFVSAAAATVVSTLESYGISAIQAPKLQSITDTRYTTAGTANNANSSNVMRNAQMFGTGGAASLPDGFSQALTGAPTVVYTKLASPLNAADGTLNIDYTGADGSNVLIQSASMHADIVPGRTVQVAFELELPADIANVRIGAGLIVAASGTTGEAGKQIGMSSLVGTTYKAGTYRLISQPWTVPSYMTPTEARFFVQFVASGGAHTNSIVRIRQARVDILS